MNNANHTRFALMDLMRLLAISLLLCSWNAEATAPRISAKMFGEELQVDVVGYDSGQRSSAAEIEGKLTADLLQAAFQAGGAQPNVDVLPSKQLAKYEFIVNQVPVLIVSADDLNAKERARYRLVTYFLSDVAQAKSPVLLAFDLKRPRSDQLFKAFDKGMQAIIKSGKYRDILQQHLGKEAVSADYFNNLKRLNPSWK